MRDLGVFVKPPTRGDSWFWATVATSDPLTIVRDGEVGALAASPDTLVGTLAPGQRVWVQLRGSRLIVHGCAGGASPAPVTFTPVLKAASTDPTLGTGSTARGLYWFLPGGMVRVNIGFRFGTSGTNAGSGTYRPELPVGISSDFYTVGQTGLADIIGSFVTRDQSDAASSVAGNVVIADIGNNEVRMELAGAGAVVNATVPWAWTTQDGITIAMEYRHNGQVLV